VKVFETCIGNEDGRIKIRQNAYSQASSILPMRTDKDQGAVETLYDGEPLFEDLLLHLRAAGFRFVRPLNFLRNRAGGVIQMDALFNHTSR